MDSIYQGCEALQSSCPFDHRVEIIESGGPERDVRYIAVRLYLNMHISALAYIKDSLVVFDPRDQNPMFNLCIYPLEKSQEADVSSSSSSLLFKAPN